MALRHFAFGRCRKTHAQPAKPLELIVAQRMAVHDVDVLAQQPGGLQLVPALGRARRTTALVHGRDQPQVFGHGKVVQGEFQR